MRYETFVVNYPAGTDVVKDNMLNATDMMIYPNPTSDYIVVEGIVGEEVFIYSLEGQCVYQSTMHNAKCTIDASGFLAGTYIVKLGSASCKVIIK